MATTKRAPAFGEYCAGHPRPLSKLLTVAILPRSSPNKLLICFDLYRGYKKCIIMTCLTAYTHWKVVLEALRRPTGIQAGGAHAYAS